jgi:AcrR family transcriptional regulator
MILDAAERVVADVGIDGLTMPMLAGEANVSRQYLYEYFHSSSEVVESLFDRVHDTYFLNSPLLADTDGSVRTRALRRLAAFLSLPIAACRVVAAALLVTESPGASRRLVRERMRAIINTNWVQPLIDLGVPSEIADSSVGAVVAVTLYFREMIEEGRLSQDTALSQIELVIAALVPQGTYPLNGAEDSVEV